MLVKGKLNNRARKPPGAVIRQNLFCPFFFVIAVFAALVMSPWTPNRKQGKAFPVNFNHMEFIQAWFHAFSCLNEHIFTARLVLSNDLN